MDSEADEHCGINTFPLLCNKWVTNCQVATVYQPGIERVQALADISCSCYVAIATKPVHRLQIHPIVHNEGSPFTISPSYICSSVDMRPWTDRHTHTHRRTWPTYISRLLRLTRTV